MSDVIIKISKDESKWPGTSKRTRVTGFGVGLHSMTAEHWNARVEFVGKGRIEEALKRGDLELLEGES